MIARYKASPGVSTSLLVFGDFMESKSCRVSSFILLIVMEGWGLAVLMSSDPELLLWLQNGHPAL